jgi:Cellulase (glycosyl hydrolase family 5)
MSFRPYLPVIAVVLLGVALLALAVRNGQWFVSGGFSRPPRVVIRPPGPPLQLDRENPHYFLFRGQTTPLIGASPGYGEVTNLDVDYASLLDQLSSAGLNKLRIFTGDFIIVESGEADSLHAAPNRFVKPWARSTTPGYAGSPNQFKFDLNTWDNDFFNRLDRFVSLASEKGLVVEVSLFSQHYNDAIWNFSPLKSDNNVNGVTHLRWQEFFTLSDPALVERQDAYVRRVVTSLNRFDNVYFEIANEASGAAWHDHMAKTIMDTEAALPNKHLIAVDGPELYSAMSVKPSVLNTHYVNDLGAHGKIHWIAAFPMLDDYYRLNIPLGFDETAVTPKEESVEDARVEAWEFIVGGGSVYDNLNSPRPSRSLQACLRALKDFMLGFNLQTMRQDKSVISSGLSQGAIWRGSSDGKSQYAIYIHHSVPGPNRYQVVRSRFHENLQLRFPPGSYHVTWINPATGRALKTTTVISTGTVALQSPGFETDIALTIVAKNKK